METFLTILFLLGLFVVLPVVILVLRDRSERVRMLGELHEKTPEQWRAEREAESARLLNPRFAEVEAGLGCRIPASLKRLYANPELLQDGGWLPMPGSSDPDMGWDINAFLPIDGPTVSMYGFHLDDETARAFGLKAAGHILPFATNLTGGTYYLPLAECTEEDGPVYLADEGEMEKVADSLDDFVGRLRPESA